MAIMVSHHSLLLLVFPALDHCFCDAITDLTQEMMTTMARVIFLFDFEAEKSADGKLIGGGFTMPGKGGHMEYQVQDMFVCEKDGPMISFTPRKI